LLAFAWFWHGSGHDTSHTLAQRLAASLCAGIGGSAGHAAIDGLDFAYRPLAGNAAQVRAWRPAALDSGAIVAFHGHIDNAAALSAALNTDPGDLALLYGRAVERWGRDADLRTIGEYCAIVAYPKHRRVRLSRSPLRAPPLVYHHNTSREGAGGIAAASVPRALFAAGVEERLNRTKVADSAWINYTSQEESWFDGVHRVPLGCTVTVRPGDDPGGRKLDQYYDIGAIPDVAPASDADHIARASELLDEGVRAALAGSKRPGVTLSSGLDTPQVATRVLAQLPPGQRLPSFTFRPEAGWDGIVPRGMNGDEAPMVEAFAAMHPALDPHFADNAGYGHDHRWPELFHAMGGAPSGLCNMYVLHGVFEAARREGCDRLLLAEWGNYTFSAKGEWGFVEYLLKGRWRELYRALKDHPHDPRSMLRKFVALSLVPMLPDAVWPLMKRLVHADEKLPLELMSPLSADYRAATGVEERARNTGFPYGRFQPRNRRQAQAQIFVNGDAESSEVYQAFEQLYGVAQRDPMAYRPFAEFCMGLPTRMFMQGGELRWMAKQMARGIMPDEQRANSLNGRWDADWHLRIGRRRTEFRAEFERIAQHPTLSGMIDTERMIAALDAFPDQTSTDPQVWLQVELGVPRALLTARFVDFVERSNRI